MRAFIKSIFRSLLNEGIEKVISSVGDPEIPYGSKTRASLTSQKPTRKASERDIQNLESNIEYAKSRVKVILNNINDKIERNKAEEYFHDVNMGKGLFNFSIYSDGSIKPAETPQTQRGGSKSVRIEPGDLKQFQSGNYVAAVRAHTGRKEDKENLAHIKQNNLDLDVENEVAYGKSGADDARLKLLVNMGPQIIDSLIGGSYTLDKWEPKTPEQLTAVEKGIKKKAMEKLRALKKPEIGSSPESQLKNKEWAERQAELKAKYEKLRQKRVR